jgi:chaperonin GroEL
MRTNNEAGDGTTTATVLARAVFKAGCKSVSAGMNPNELRKGILKAVDEVVESLKNMATPLDSFEDFADVATISANGDREIGTLLSQIFERVGVHGSITVRHFLYFQIEDGKTLNTTAEYVDGMQIDRGYLSPHFITDTKVSSIN